MGGVIEVTKADLCLVVVLIVVLQVTIVCMQLWLIKTIKNAKRG